MMNIKLLLSFLLLAFLNTAKAQQAPLTADDIMKEAFSTAKNENKKVFIMFHASWCGWCHKMDASMNDPICKKLFDDNFVIRHLVVMESKGKENLENPGGMEMLTTFNGKDQGIPFWLIFDKNENLITDSRMQAPTTSADTKLQNTGCPANKEEVDFFIEVLKKSTPLKDEDLEKIRTRFRKNEVN